MELKLKTVSKGGISRALATAEIYRYLNEPEETESICRDILAVESDNQAALRMLGLAMAHQFYGGPSDRCPEPTRLLTSKGSERDGQISPDGKWGGVRIG